MKPSPGVRLSPMRIVSPSACNSQPWKFIIVDDNVTKKAFADNVFSGPYKMNSFAQNAAAYIIIVSEKPKLPSWVGGKIRRTDFRLIDIGIACGNLLLAAQDLGVGTCVLGWFNERSAKKILFVPRTKKIELIIAMGYTSRLNFPEKIVKEPNETVAFNSY